VSVLRHILGKHSLYVVCASDLLHSLQASVDVPGNGILQPPLLL